MTNSERTMDRPARMRKHPPTSAATAYILAAAQENAVEGADSHHRSRRNCITVPGRTRPTLGAGGNPVTGGCLNRPELGKRLTPAVRQTAEVDTETR